MVLCYEWVGGVVSMAEKRYVMAAVGVSETRPDRVGGAGVVDTAEARRFTARDDP